MTIKLMDSWKESFKIQMLRLKSIKFYVEISKKILSFKKSELVYYPLIISIVYFVYIHICTQTYIHSKKITIKAINTIIFNIRKNILIQMSH